MKSIDDKNGVIAVGEGPDMPSAPEAIVTFQECGVMVAPGRTAKAGGAGTSALEMQQNASRDSGSVDQTDARLATIMRGIHAICHDTTEEYGAPVDHLLGADVAGLVGVAESVRKVI